MAKHHLPAESPRLKFFLGFGMLISLVYYSALRQHQPGVYELAAVLALTLAALIFDYRKTGQFLSLIREKKISHRSHESAIRSALAGTLKCPLLLKLLETELLTLYYAFFAKAEPPDTVGDNTVFGYERSSNANDMFLVVAVAQLPLLPFIHFFVEHQKGPAPAWVITLVTLWSVIWYLAQVEAVKRLPVELGDEHLVYRFGLIWKAEVPLSKIKLARAFGVTEEPDGSDLFFSPMGSKRNVYLEFETPAKFCGPYWIRSRKRGAVISIDDPLRFLRHLAEKGVPVE
ncbi:MAG: hypothetical protein QNJ40_24685 [Xanthomonadales bacterium]|nr:hypothetical protein [Xanthomonadales bacterium]